VRGRVEATDAVVGLQTDDGGSRDPDAELVRLQLTVWEQQL
jgi:hypothetical protein